MIRSFFIFAFLIITTFLRGQIGHGGNPMLKPADKIDEVVSVVQKMQSLPLQIQQMAGKPSGKKGDALRFAHPFFVELTPANSGEWVIMENGVKIWRLGIKSDGAYSINLIFDRFNLIPGDSLFIFNPDQSLVLGAFTYNNNQPEGILATAPIPGDQVIVELRSNSNSVKESGVLIGAVNHDYLNLFSYLKGGVFGDSGDCHVDFTCNDNGIWSLAGRSVCKIIVDGTGLCSGTLLNNSRNDGTPYFLTAAHCLKQSNSASTVVFFFNYQVPNCETTIEGTPQQTLSGSYLRAFGETLDFALLEMTVAPPATYRPFWAGWSRTTSPSAPVKAIHHPEGDVKKVAQSNTAPTSATFSASSPLGNPFLSNSHWRVASWQAGTTEPGSSGCALFDNNGLLIGSLSGGSASCSNPVNDYFSRLNKSWNHFPESNKQLAYWLDPDNANPESVSGIDYYDGEVERLSNFVKGDVATLKYLNPGKGVWSGHNSLLTKSIAENYAWVKTATIHGIYLLTAKSPFFSTKTVNLRIWDGLFEPENLLATKNGIPLGQLRQQRENLVMLNSPVTIDGSFWIEVEFDYTASVDSFAVFQSAPSATRIKNTAWIKSAQNDWIEFEDFNATNYPSAFWIDVLASDVQKIDTSVARPIGNSLLVYPNPACSQLNLRLDNDGSAIIELYNMVGQQVYKGSLYIFQGEGAINFSGLTQGLHLLKLSINNQVFYQKVLISTCN